MLNSWTVTGMAKNHYSVSIVYRDTTQADYEVGADTYQPPSRNASTGSSHPDSLLDTGESFFFDDLCKPFTDGGSLKDGAPNLMLDDVFPSFDLQMGPRVPDPSERMFSLPAVKVLPALHRASAEPSSLSQEFSPVGMDMWDQNETFQDLSGLIEEEKCQTPAATPSPLHYLVPSEDGHQRSNHSQSWDQRPQPAPVKRSYEAPACEAGPSHVDMVPSPKMLKVDEDCNGRYSEMRVKNNMASRRSRMTRKEKEQEMEKRASELEQENEALRIKVKNLEEVTDRLKQHLINSIVKK
ncbi:DNA damage-inducible transcript 3 protein isoform X1 [Ixodes scapularis]|uniref:DNA damage-inducible transcript 3 protein isoform X1 n=1 Tax=Ixodes scapularis TaxID=6945 RepID=UPI001A9F96D4|nr:DNA damage-inducible transcript 3 protein isoform X1 [Ixodes scapularis]XP_029846760.2 DNA damage-inducible transcript 3 protein isoform X1 [Ixodes scapularis]